MDLIVKTPHLAAWNCRDMRCAVGRGGIVMPDIKNEGDGATPAGRWAMREIIYRADRINLPQTKLPARAMTPDDGWCENPADAQYNKPVKHPYPIAVDEMWRQDHIYDIVVPLGYNDGPIIPGKGSAIFLHLARPDYAPSAGCVTLAQEDLLTVLREADLSSAVEIRLA